MQSLRAEKREIFGKALAAARKAGRIPAVVYGPQEPSLSCFVMEADFRKIWKEAGESSVVALAIEGLAEKEVLIHDVEVHPVSGVPRHVDFYAIEAGKKVEVSVPLVFVGLAPGVKNLGATLVKVMYELEIAAMPADLPHEITVDVSSLETLENQIKAKDIKLPKGVELLNSPEEVVAALAEQKEEEEAPPAPADLSAIEVEKKGKKEEEGVVSDETRETVKKTEAGKK